MGIVSAPIIMGKRNWLVTFFTEKMLHKKCSNANFPNNKDIEDFYDEFDLDHERFLEIVKQLEKELPGFSTNMGNDWDIKLIRREMLRTQWRKHKRKAEKRRIKAAACCHGSVDVVQSITKQQ